MPVLHHPLIPYHETHDILDSTKIKCYLECPRKYFYEYVLGWRPRQTNVHLVFGDALHQGLELLETHRDLWPDPDKRAELVQAAFQLFYTRFRQEINEEQEQLHRTKTCESAAVALEQYPQHYMNEICNVLFSEVAGVVYITPTDKLHYRMDLIFQDEYGIIWNRDHKTASNFSPQWVSDFTLSPQVWIYSHVLHSTYEAARVGGVEINGIQLGKTIKRGVEVSFMRIPIRKSLDMLQSGLWHMRLWVKQLAAEWQNLTNCADSQEVMEAFPQNPSACSKYNGCPFADFCSHWPNPLRHCAEPPIGFTVYRWNPAEHNSTAKTVVNIPNEE